jgi:hypothetical protein
LSATSKALDASGGGGTIVVTAGGGLPCRWKVSSSAAWLTPENTSGVDSGSVSFTTEANRTGISRAATLAIGPLSVQVTQKAVTQRTVGVSTARELQAAVTALASYTTLDLAPGVYRLPTTLVIRGNLTDVVIKGATGRAGDVVLDGTGATSPDGQPVDGIRIAGARRFQIADVTVRNFTGHAVVVESGAVAPVLSNLSLIDDAEPFVKVYDSVDGVLERSRLEHGTARSVPSAGAVDLAAAGRWTIRDNVFSNFIAGRDIVAAVQATAGSWATVVERNRFMNCAAAVQFGAGPRAGSSAQHRDGSITNNFFYRAASAAGGPAIVLADSPGARVLHNTMLTSGTSRAAIELRYATTTDVIVANNLLDAAVVALDNAWAVQTGNLTNATPDLFVNADGGDLHLKPTAVSAIDVADVSVAVATDIDGQARPSGLGADVGADELWPGDSDQATAPPS